MSRERASMMGSPSNGARNQIRTVAVDSVTLRFEGKWDYSLAAYNGMQAASVSQPMSVPAVWSLGAGLPFPPTIGRSSVGNEGGWRFQPRGDDGARGGPGFGAGAANGQGTAGRGPATNSSQVREPLCP